MFKISTGDFVKETDTVVEHSTIKYNEALTFQ